MSLICIEMTAQMQVSGRRNKINELNRLLNASNIQLVSVCVEAIIPKINLVFFWFSMFYFLFTIVSESAPSLCVHAFDAIVSFHIFFFSLFVVRLIFIRFNYSKQDV